MWNPLSSFSKNQPQSNSAKTNLASHMYCVPSHPCLIIDLADGGVVLHFNDLTAVRAGNIKDLGFLNFANYSGHSISLLIYIFDIYKNFTVKAGVILKHKANPNRSVLTVIAFRDYETLSKKGTGHLLMFLL